jgi:hypothetical protein
MRRIASFVLGLAAIVAAWLFVPRSIFAPTPVTISTADLTSTERTVAEIDVELARMHDRVTATTVSAESTRNPFSYGALPAPPPSKLPPPPPPPPAPPPAPTLPKLIAISSKATSGGVVRSAALSVADNVVIAHPGDTVGTLVVRTIGDEFVELVDPATGTAYRVK